MQPGSNTPALLELQWSKRTSGWVMIHGTYPLQKIAGPFPLIYDLLTYFLSEEYSFFLWLNNFVLHCLFWISYFQFFQWLLDGGFPAPSPVFILAFDTLHPPRFSGLSASKVIEPSDWWEDSQLKVLGWPSPPSQGSWLRWRCLFSAMDLYLLPARPS